MPVHTACSSAEANGDGEHQRAAAQSGSQRFEDGGRHLVGPGQVKDGRVEQPGGPQDTSGFGRKRKRDDSGVFDRAGDLLTCRAINAVPRLDAFVEDDANMIGL